MPKNKVKDPITDLEMAYARQVLTGRMTDRQAAEAVGLNPDSAACIKSKPQVRAYMAEQRAAVEQLPVQQEADTQRRLNLDRERVLDRLWEIAGLSPEATRGSITGQVKALSMIIAMQNFIPDARSGGRPASPAKPWGMPQDVDDPERAPSSGAEAPPKPGPSQFTLAKPFSPSQASRVTVPLFTSIPDLGVDFPRKINPFVDQR